MSELRDKILEVVTSLPPGEVVTYGEVATEAGRPGAARAVGKVMAEGNPGVPWWRVVNSVGRLVPGHEVEQRRRLTAEGVEVTERGVRMGRR